MGSENSHFKQGGKRDHIDMYFDEKVAERFARHEQNEKNFRVADIIDKLVNNETETFSDPLYIADLGAGAHPDRYHKLFERLLKDPKGQMDWVDISPVMLDLADKYLEEQYRERREVILYVNKEILQYLQDLPDETLDIVIMKYTFDYIQDIDAFFELLVKKLKKGGSGIVTMTTLSPELKSVSTNARYLYNGQVFPDNETRTLKDGDTFTIKFFKESGNPVGGYIPGAETEKYFYSKEKIIESAKNAQLHIFIGDWKDCLPQEKQGEETMDQAVMILKKI